MSESEVLDTKPDCSEEPESAASPEPESAASPEPESAASPEPESAASPEPESAASPEPESAASPIHSQPKEEEEDGISSSGECDSPEPNSKDEVEKFPDQIVSKKENCTLLRPMDGELDYEDEVDEDKEKKTFDLEKKEDAEPEKKDDNELEEGEEEDEKKDTTAPKTLTKQKNETEKEDSMEEGEDEGEISDDDLEEGEVKETSSKSETTHRDDLEEGEVKEASPKPETTRQVCRFYGRGQCFYGNACRFLHLNHNEKGQYNMFAPRYSQGYGYGPGNLMGPSNPMMSERLGPRMDYMAAAPPPAPLIMEPSPVETAWERGLREAKELVKKANKRKEEEPDFDKKKLNLSLNVNERSSPEYDKENEFYYSRAYQKRNDGHFKKSNPRYEEPCDFYENDRAARENFRSGRFENFEVRYTREDVPRDRRGRERSRGRMSSERERYASKEGRNKDRLKDDRMFDVQMRARAFDYVDPWRRSKTPKARRTHSRSGSYSSVSSYSYSDRSSRSSGSYSRSSSRSSASSRSPSVMHKRKPSPVAETALSPKAGAGRFPMIKKKPTGRPNRSSSSRSRSPSRTPSASRSRSRSYSRSISMDSVSSASSSVSHSSSGSGPRRNRGHGSLLRKNDEKLSLDKLDSRNIPYDRPDGDAREDMYSSEANVDSAFPSFSHLLPNDSKGKGQHKQIKLTLLNKSSSAKATAFPKKELDRSKLLGDQKSDSSKQDSTNYPPGSKRPLSPSLSATTKSNTTPKKSASSRRDELLKQLKAVEDAIARKRAKFC